jgi:hypothetical protein
MDFETRLALAMLILVTFNDLHSYFYGILIDKVGWGYQFLSIALSVLPAHAIAYALYHFWIRRWQFDNTYCFLVILICCVIMEFIWLIGTRISEPKNRGYIFYISVVGLLLLTEVCTIAYPVFKSFYL